MKKTLAIVLALVMVLCMIPAMSAETITEYKGSAYNISVYEIANDATGAYAGLGTKALGTAKGGTSVEAKYDFEAQVADATDKWAEDRKMAVVRVEGWNKAFKDLKGYNWEVKIDNDKIEVGSAAYKDLLGAQLEKVEVVDEATGKKSSYKQFAYVQFPVELTKAGYSDSFLVTLTATKGDQVVTQTAKISVKMVNVAGYKAEKEATIVDIKSDDVAAYIVGERIYLDYVEKEADADPAEIAVTFVDDNKAPFTAITYANTPKNADNLKVKATNIDANGGEYKLANSTAKYTVSGAEAKVVFELETINAYYYTPKYDIVIRYGIKEEDPKGIYFAETTKTIAMGETYAPVVLGVATGKKVNAKIDVTKAVDKQVLDNVDDYTIIGTREGVAYITASYTPAGKNKPYTASSMKIVVTLPGTSIPPVAAEPTTYYVSCRNLNVRRTPATTYKAVGMVHRGDALQVVEIANGWAKLADGTYVCEKYIYKK